MGGIFPSGPLSAGGIIKNVSSFSGDFLNDLCYYVNKNLSVKPLSSIWIISVFITISSLGIVQFVANLTMITALKCSGLSLVFRYVIEKIKMLFTSLGRSVLGKTVPSVLSTALGLRPKAVSKTSGTVFPNTDPPAGE